MATPRRTMSASDLKARCLRVLDEVADSGVEVLVTKRGTPVARVAPLADRKPLSLIGSVRYESEDDLLSSVESPFGAKR
jgi:prevent-host-death family protein